MGWWVAGAVLVAAVAWSVWDVGRPGRASGAALLTLRAVGGLALLAMAAQSLDAGAGAAAATAAGAAVPLLVGLFRTGAARAAAPVRAIGMRPELTRVVGDEQERRAA